MSSTYLFFFSKTPSMTNAIFFEDVSQALHESQKTERNRILGFFIPSRILALLGCSSFSIEEVRLLCDYSSM